MTHRVTMTVVGCRSTNELVDMINNALHTYGALVEWKIEGVELLPPVIDEEV